MIMTNKVLIVCAHPDDEVIGMGGTIAKHTLLGDDVRVIFMANGVSSREFADDNESIDERRKAAKKAGAILGIQKLIFNEFYDNKMDAHDLLDIIKSIESVIKSYQPSVVYTHHGGDLNIDHRLTYQAVMTACRPAPGFCVKEIYAFEVLSSTNWAFGQNMNQFVPSYFVDISQTVEAKMQALEAYTEEILPYPHSRSFEAIKALSMFRGTTTGFQFAEAFFIERILS